MTASSTAPPVLRRIVGQPRAREILAASVSRPVHAYLFVGPAGSGKLEAARAFAAALVCSSGGCGECPSCRDVARGVHPDVVVFEREGAAITVDDARHIAAAAQRTPRSAPREVLILTEFHLVAGAAPAMLKTLEEPPATTVFLVLADAVPPSLVTIQSRCVSVPFVPLARSVIAGALESDGVAADVAADVAASALGSVDRARLLAADDGFRARQEMWRSLPDRLDGTGATVAVAVAEVVASIDAVLDVVRARQAAELAELRESADLRGDPRVAERAHEDRNRREQRRLRTEELRAGLATLETVYLDRLTAQGIAPRHATSLGRACDLVADAERALVRNPNETLLLEALFARLGDLAS